MEWKAGSGNRLVDYNRARSRQRRTKNVRDPVIRARMEVTTRARGSSVTAQLGIPEKRFSQRY
jgi:hypothetical protein